MSGTVVDQQGGVVPGVTVNAINLQTRQTRTVVTDATGFYNLAQLNPGQYDVSAELDGFKKANRANVQLDASANITIGVRLSAVNRELDTYLQTQLRTETSGGSYASTLSDYFGRLQAVFGQPGLKAGVIGGSFNNYGFSSLSNGSYNINGSRGDENNITVDGATAIRTRSAGAAIGVQNVDAIQEVQVLTANYMPEFGRASGGQIRMVTKSGGQRYSGTASYFMRDDSLQANTWSRNRANDGIQNVGPAPFDYKQCGYSFGGPIPGDMFKEVLLLRRAGVGQLPRRPEQRPHGADRADADR